MIGSTQRGSYPTGLGLSSCRPFRGALAVRATLVLRLLRPAAAWTGVATTSSASVIRAAAAGATGTNFSCVGPRAVALAGSGTGRRGVRKRARQTGWRLAVRPAAY